MKKILVLLSVVLLSFIQTFAADIDTSIIDELKKGEVEQLNVDFKLKTFQSCQNLETVMEKYIKDYYTVNKDRYNSPVLYRNFGMVDDVMMMDSVDEGADLAESKVAATSVESESAGGSDDFSKTNSQVEGVDESDIIKTDGKYVYYYNQSKKYIYIIEAYGTDQMKVLKQIKLPTTFSQPVLYIGDNKLIILASGYSQTNYAARGYYINRNSKTYTIVYDTTNKAEPKLEKLYVNDGDLRKSRKIGKYVYVISNNNFSIPYYNFKSVDDIDVSINNILPKKLEISKTANSGDQNLKIKGKALPYNIKAGNVAKCSDIEYSLPDAETLKKFDFNPSYNIISIINTEDSSAEVKTKVVAGSNSEIYMSLDNLYLTDSIYQTQNFACPTGAICAMPMFWGGTSNTLLHKMNINANNLSYQNSSILPGRPLNQYSMDEKDENFRIITSTNNWGPEREQHTDLYVLDKDLKVIGSLNNLGEGEDYKSSRFMGDKLYLVTFEQVDPFFVIDLEDDTNPEVIGELKIPGFSEYLHPYDENHIIGLGRDTYEVNDRVRTGGLKLDLYEINYDKTVGISTDCENYTESECPEYCKVKIWSAEEECDGDVECMSLIGRGENKCVAKQEVSKSEYIEVKQKFTKTLGDQGSSSEATYNPRMFMWNSDKNLLFLPATLYTKFSKEDYRNKDYFQGLVTLNIDKTSGITEKYRLTHIDYVQAEKDRLADCSKYSQPEEPECRELIDGSMYCGGSTNKYVPQYCYADSTVGEYIANRSWNYNKSFVKRALWIGDNVYSISDEKLVKSDITTGTSKDMLEMK